MKAVIQCATTKRFDAGRLITRDGKLVEFVAHPELAPAQANRIYARPDDISDRGMSWREQLWKYNENEKTNGIVCISGGILLSKQGTLAGYYQA